MIYQKKLNKSIDSKLKVNVTVALLKRQQGYLRILIGGITNERS